jgi:hypothetical protein
MKNRWIYTLPYRAAMIVMLVIIDISAIELWNRPELIPSHVMGAIWTGLLNVTGLVGIALSWFTRPGYRFYRGRLKIRNPETWFVRKDHNSPWNMAEHRYTKPLVRVETSKQLEVTNEQQN